jgi:hypothetical protein
VKIVVYGPFEAIGSITHVDQVLPVRFHLDDGLGMLQTKMGEHEQAAQNRAAAAIRHAHDVGFDVLVNSTLKKSRDNAGGDLRSHTHALKPESGG